MDPGGLDTTILYPDFLQQQLTPPPQPQENQAAEDLGSAATSPPQAVVPSVWNPTFWAVTQTLCVCVEK